MVMNAMKERRSIRKYKPDMVPREVIEQILEAGLYAASGRGQQCVITVAVTNKELRDKLSRMNAQVLGTDALSYLTRPNDRFDLVFLDPPYAAELLIPALTKVAPLVNDGGIIVCETEDGIELPQRVDRFAVAKTYRFGRIHVWLYRYDVDGED